MKARGAKGWVQEYVETLPKGCVWVVAGVPGTAKTRLLMEAADELSRRNRGVAVVDSDGYAPWLRGGVPIKATQSIKEAISWAESVKPGWFFVDGLQSLDEDPEIGFLKLEQLARRIDAVLCCSMGSIRTKKGQVAFKSVPIFHRGSMIWEPQAVGRDYVDLVITKCRHLELPFNHRISAEVSLPIKR